MVINFEVSDYVFHLFNHLICFFIIFVSFSFYLLMWINFFLVITFDILSCAINFFSMIGKVFLVHTLIVTVLLIVFLGLLLCLVYNFLCWLCPFWLNFYHSFIYYCFFVVILSCCSLNMLFLSQLFWLCFSCDLCFWYALKLYSLLLFSGYILLCEIFLYYSSFHLLYLFVSFFLIWKHIALCCW